MSKSNRGGLTGRRSGGTVTVIEEPVRRSAVRKAKIVFWICWITIGLLSATVLASKWHPILALLAGFAIGLVAAAVIAALVIAWPVLRALWWWAPEIGLTLGLVTGWVDLADHTTLPIRLARRRLHHRRSRRHPAGPPPPRGHRVVPDHPAPDPDLLRRIHHHQPHRQPALPAADHPHLGRGTGLDLAAPRPGPDRHSGPARPDRRRLLG